MGGVVLCTPWVFSFRLSTRCLYFFFQRGNTDSLRVGMCTGYVLETVVMMYSLGGDTLYISFPSKSILM